MVGWLVDYNYKMQNSKHDVEMKDEEVKKEEPTQEKDAPTDPFYGKESR